MAGDDADKLLAEMEGGGAPSSGGIDFAALAAKSAPSENKVKKPKKDNLAGMKQMGAGIAQTVNEIPYAGHYLHQQMTQAGMVPGEFMRHPVETGAAALLGGVHGAAQLGESLGGLIHGGVRQATGLDTTAIAQMLGVPQAGPGQAFSLGDAIAQSPVGEWAQEVAPGAFATGGTVGSLFTPIPGARAIPQALAATKAAAMLGASPVGKFAAQVAARTPGLIKGAAHTGAVGAALEAGEHGLHGENLQVTPEGVLGPAIIGMGAHVAGAPFRKAGAAKKAASAKKVAEAATLQDIQDVYAQPVKQPLGLPGPSTTPAAPGLLSEAEVLQKAQQNQAMQQAAAAQMQQQAAAPKGLPDYQDPAQYQQLLAQQGMAGAIPAEIRPPGNPMAQAADAILAEKMLQAMTGQYGEPQGQPGQETLPREGQRAAAGRPNPPSQTARFQQRYAPPAPPAQEQPHANLPVHQPQVLPSVVHGSVQGENPGMATQQALTGQFARGANPRASSRVKVMPAAENAQPERVIENPEIVPPESGGTPEPAPVQQSAPSAPAPEPEKKGGTAKVTFYPGGAPNKGGKARNVEKPFMEPEKRGQPITQGTGQARVHAINSKQFVIVDEHGRPMDEPYNSKKGSTGNPYVSETNKARIDAYNKQLESQPQAKQQPHPQAMTEQELRAADEHLTGRAQDTTNPMTPEESALHDQIDAEMKRRGLRQVVAPPKAPAPGEGAKPSQPAKVNEEMSSVPPETQSLTQPLLNSQQKPSEQLPAQRKTTEAQKTTSEPFTDNEPEPENQDFGPTSLTHANDAERFPGYNKEFPTNDDYVNRQRTVKGKTFNWRERYNESQDRGFTTMPDDVLRDTIAWYHEQLAGSSGTKYEREKWAAELKSAEMQQAYRVYHDIAKGQEIPPAGEPAEEPPVMPPEQGEPAQSGATPAGVRQTTAEVFEPTGTKPSAVGEYLDAVYERNGMTDKAAREAADFGKGREGKIEGMTYDQHQEVGKEFQRMVKQAKETAGDKDFASTLHEIVNNARRKYSGITSSFGTVGMALDIVYDLLKAYSPRIGAAAQRAGTKAAANLGPKLKDWRIGIKTAAGLMLDHDHIARWSPVAAQQWFNHMGDIDEATRNVDMPRTVAQREGAMASRNLSEQELEDLYTKPASTWSKPELQDRARKIQQLDRAQVDMLKKINKSVREISNLFAGEYEKAKLAGDKGAMTMLNEKYREYTGKDVGGTEAPPTRQSATDEFANNFYRAVVTGNWHIHSLHVFDLGIVGPAYFGPKNFGKAQVLAANPEIRQWAMGTRSKGVYGATKEDNIGWWDKTVGRGVDKAAEFVNERIPAAKGKAKYVEGGFLEDEKLARSRIAALLKIGDDMGIGGENLLNYFAKRGAAPKGMTPEIERQVRGHMMRMLAETSGFTPFGNRNRNVFQRMGKLTKIVQPLMGTITTQSRLAYDFVTTGAEALAKGDIAAASSNLKSAAMMGAMVVALGGPPPMILNAVANAVDPIRAIQFRSWLRNCSIISKYLMGGREVHHIGIQEVPWAAASWDGLAKTAESVRKIQEGKASPHDLLRLGGFLADGLTLGQITSAEQIRKVYQAWEEGKKGDEAALQAEEIGGEQRGTKVHGTYERGIGGEKRVQVGGKSKLTTSTVEEFWDLLLPANNAKAAAQDFNRNNLNAIRDYGRVHYPTQSKAINKDVKALWDKYAGQTEENGAMVEIPADEYDQMLSLWQQSHEYELEQAAQRAETGQE